MFSRHGLSPDVRVIPKCCSAGEMFHPHSILSEAEETIYCGGTALSPEGWDTNNRIVNKDLAWS